MNQNYKIKKFEVNKATYSDWEALNRFSKVFIFSGTPSEAMPIIDHHFSEAHLELLQ